MAPRWLQSLYDMLPRQRGHSRDTAANSPAVASSEPHPSISIPETPPGAGSCPSQPPSPYDPWSRHFEDYEFRGPPPLYTLLNFAAWRPHLVQPSSSPLFLRYRGCCMADVPHRELEALGRLQVLDTTLGVQIHTALWPGDEDWDMEIRDIEEVPHPEGRGWWRSAMAPGAEPERHERLDYLITEAGTRDYVHQIKDDGSLAICPHQLAEFGSLEPYLLDWQWRCHVHILALRDEAFYVNGGYEIEYDERKASHVEALFLAYAMARKPMVNRVTIDLMGITDVDGKTFTSRESDGTELEASLRWIETCRVISTDFGEPWRTWRDDRLGPSEESGERIILRGGRNALSWFPCRDDDQEKTAESETTTSLEAPPAAT